MKFFNYLFNNNNNNNQSTQLMNQGMFANVPDDVTQLIFTHLDDNSLVRAQEVNRKFKRLASKVLEKRYIDTNFATNIKAAIVEGCNIVIKDQIRLANQGQTLDMELLKTASNLRKLTQLINTNSQTAWLLYLLSLATIYPHKQLINRVCTSIVPRLIKHQTFANPQDKKLDREQLIQQIKVKLTKDLKGKELETAQTNLKKVNDLFSLRLVKLGHKQEHEILQMRLLKLLPLLSEDQNVVNELADNDSAFMTKFNSYYTTVRKQAAKEQLMLKK